MCANPYCLNPATCTATYSNFPVRYVPERDRSQQVDRHLDLFCMCPLIDCCHNEFPDRNYSFSDYETRGTVHSGSPKSGYLYPWEPGDESPCSSGRSRGSPNSAGDVPSVP